ncbi:MAG: thiol-activated cytolysin family protein [Myxococcota bacterium]
MLRTTLIGLALVACGGADRAENDPEAAAYLNRLPDYPDAPEPHNKAVGGADFDYGTDQVCSTTTYSIQDAPEDVVMFNADPQVFWPGALLQGDSYEAGSPLLIPLPGRATLDLSISGLYADESAAFDVEPTPSAVTAAINALLNGAVRDELPTTQSVFFKQEEAYSFEQSALELGFSARDLGASVSGGLSYDTSSETNTVAANATIRTFTVSVDPPTTPSSFFEGLTQEELQEQIDLGRLSENNVPVYVASVTYGQIMMFSASSSESMSDLKAALSASFNSFAGGGSAGLSVEQEQLLQGSSLQVVTLGGSEEGVADMIRDGDPSAFFRGSTVVTSSVPIAYTLKDLNGNVVKVGEVTEYGLTTCSPNGFANFYVLNDGGSTTGYYGDGSRADLTSENIGSSAALDIEYDALNDRLLVLDPDFESVVNRIEIYEADGTRPADGALRSFPVQDGLWGLTYDPVNARVYTIGASNGRDGFDTDLARAWSLDGQDLNLSFSADIPREYAYIAGFDGAYDAATDRLYIVGVVNGFPGDYGTVWVFDRRGNPVEVAGDFPGIEATPGLRMGIAVDPNLERIYVSDALGDRVHVFDLEGRPLDLPTPMERLASPSSLHFDPLFNRLYVLEAGASLITAFEPDGTEAVGLATPQFPGINQPKSMAFRPN